MKFIIILLIALSGAGAYLYLNPDVWQPWVKDTPLEPAPTKTQVYKWQDANGQWQITDHPPTGKTPYENLEYTSDANIVPSIPVDD
ncbi:MAG: hypothetical protein DRQ48_11850 [Gammaproteobacteria bacterium]|nr:MAG: hypothetical protein DRQ48_11850 [Gammaproteobacteria bacterium]